MEFKLCAGDCMASGEVERDALLAMAGFGEEAPVTVGFVFDALWFLARIGEFGASKLAYVSFTGLSDPFTGFCAVALAGLTELPKPESIDLFEPLTLDSAMLGA